MGISKLKRAALNLFIRDASNQSQLKGQVEQLRLQFERIDRDGSGLVGANELAQAMRELNIGVAEGEIDQIIAEIGNIGDGRINYTEFLAATLTIREALSEEMLWRLFKKFDTDDTGNISQQNLLDTFRRLGQD